MADGYARCSGRVPVFLTTAGPGATNGMTALAEAYAASSPVLHICGQVATAWLEKGKGAFHELVGLTSMFGYVTQWSYSVQAGTEVGSAVGHAIDRLRRLRPRPVHLDIPQDVLEGRCDRDGLPGNFPAIRVPHHNADAVERAAALLRTARKPVVLAGGGAISGDATRQVRLMAEALGAPVLTSLSGKGAIAADHPLSCGRVPGGPETTVLLAEADLLLAVGVRFSSTATRNWRLSLPARIVQLDIDPGEIGKNYPVEVGLVGPCADSLNELLAAVGTPGLPCWSNPTAVREQAYARDRENSPAATRYLDVLRDWLPRDGVLVSDLTTVTAIGRTYLPFYEPRTNLTPIAFGTMGFGLGVAIGAQIARPDGEVLCIAGDGGFMMHCGELATAVEEHLPLTIIIANDQGYGALRTAQRRRFGARFIGVDLTMPNLVHFAESFGCPAVRVTSPAELEAALVAPHDRGGPRLIELRAGFEHPGFRE